jgi:hypothetical protein
MEPNFVEFSLDKLDQLQAGDFCKWKKVHDSNYTVGAFFDCLSSSGTLMFYTHKYEQDQWKRVTFGVKRDSIDSIKIRKTRIDESILAIIGRLELIGKCIVDINSRLQNIEATVGHDTDKKSKK